jgi:hypothetical protein
LAAERVDQFSHFQIPRHGVDRKIPSAQIFFHRKVGIVFHLEIPMTHAGRALDSGKGDVEFGMGAVGPKFDDAEGLSHGLHVSVLGQKREELLDGELGDQKVFIFVRKTEKEIPKGASHLIDSSSFFFDRL